MRIFVFLSVNLFLQNIGCMWEVGKTQKQTIFREDLFGNFYSTSKINIYNENYQLDRSQLGTEIVELCASLNVSHISVNDSQHFVLIETFKKKNFDFF